MSDNPIFIELAKITYYFLGFSAFEIIISIPFDIEVGGQIRSRISNRFASTLPFAVFALVVAVILFYVDDYFGDTVKESLSNFGNTLLPLSVFSVSFFMFYLSRVMLHRRWLFPLTISSLIISIVSLIFTIIMFTGGNELNLIQK